MGTIVQKYGPIYGEAVNGTVQGRPNGSVYVPSSNVISIDLRDEIKYMTYRDPTHLIFCTSAGVAVAGGDGVHFVAIAQDLSSNVKLEIFRDSDLDVSVAERAEIAGNFNSYSRSFATAVDDLTDEEPIYIRAQLMNNGVPVATSGVIIASMVVP